jgi:hypothetical protein
MVGLTREFQLLCLDVSTATEHLKCKGRSYDPMARFIGPVLTGSAVVAGMAAVYALMPRMGRFKARAFIN